ncbi:MAG: helix-turn-helix transcriptional regulator [Ruminococcaceae bacterium]|nr:helix-turn-helix transcriptional regulator [Oscillospiraceae bacterium]
MISKDFQLWNMERQIQQLAAVLPEGRLLQIAYRQNGRYTDAAATGLVCRVYSVSRCIYEKDFRVAGNIPGLLDVVYIYGGQLRWTHKNTSGEAGPGALLLLSHHDKGTLTQTGSAPLEVLLIRCTGELSENFYRMLLRQAGMLHSVPQPRIDRCAQDLLHYMKYPAGSAHARLALIMTQLFSDLLLDIMDRTARKHPQWFVSAVTYMEQHYAEEITVEAMAAHVRISVPHFHRLFLEYTGQTPYRYLLELRIQKAEELLKDPLLQIKHISQDVGFRNATHFIRHFKQRTGLTPGQYRQAHYQTPSV